MSIKIFDLGNHSDELLEFAKWKTTETFGLTHCEAKSCVMYFSHSISDTDKKILKLCKNCIEKYERRL